MAIHQLCSRKVVTIDVRAPVRAAARAMADQHVGALVVTRAPSRSGAEVVGVLTDRDLVVGPLAHHATPGDVPVAEAMSRQAIAVPGTAGLAEAAATMREEGVRRLLVVGSGGRLVGIVTLDDLLDALAAELGDVVQALQTGLARERASDDAASAEGDPGEHLLVPHEAVAARWRQVSAS